MIPFFPSIALIATVLILALLAKVFSLSEKSARLAKERDELEKRLGHTTDVLNDQEIALDASIEFKVASIVRKVNSETGELIVYFASPTPDPHGLYSPCYSIDLSPLAARQFPVGENVRVRYFRMEKFG